MFAKKFLSIVGLLFTGSQLISLAKAEDCSYTTTGSETLTISNCNSGKNLILPGETGLVTDIDSECTGGDCYLVDCTAGGSCTRLSSLTGYVTIGTDVVQCSNGRCKSATLGGSNDCNSVGAGLLTSDKKFCKDNISNAGVEYSSGTNYYYVTIAQSTTNVFVDASEGAKTILVKAADGVVELLAATTLVSDTPYLYDGKALKWSTGTTVSLYNELTGGTPIYCVNGETSAIEDRKSNFCGSNVACSKYCTFTDGVCTELTTDAQFVFEKRVTCNPTGSSDEKAACKGYYIKYDGTLITSTTVLTEGSLVSLIECDGESTCKGIDSGSLPIGYIANADSSSNGAIPFIKCTANNSCTAIVAADNKSSCDAPGVLVTSNSFCLKTEGTKTAALNAEGRKFLLDASATSVFNKHEAANHFVIVKVKYGSVILHRKDDIVAEGGEFRYVYTDDTLEIFGRKDTNICSSTKTIKEFMLDKQEATIKDYTDNEYYASNGEDTTWP